MFYYYTEPVRREPNSHGRPRLVTLLGHLPGAVGCGFTGTGTDTRQGEKDGQRRVWRFEKALDSLPDGVVEIRQSEYAEIDAEREATRPPPPPEPEPREPQLTNAELIRLRAGPLAPVDSHP